MTCGRNDIPWVDEDIPIVIFDLDDTLAESVWPERREVGDPIAEGVVLLRHYADEGYRVEVFTSRPQTDLGIIWDWVFQHELPVDAITCGKPFAGLYIDDRSWRPPYARPAVDKSAFHALAKKKKRGQR